MKKLVILGIFLCSVTAFAQAQEEALQFQYDAAGNQVVSRLVCINCLEDPEAGGGENPGAETPIVLSKTTLNNLTYYPNPVTEELTLLWENNPHRRITSISVYSLSSKRVLHESPLNQRESLLLSFGKLASGIYEIVALTSDGKTQAFKILKK